MGLASEWENFLASRAIRPAAIHDAIVSTNAIFLDPKRSNKKKKGKGWKDYLYMYHIYVHVCIYIYKYKILKEEIHSFKIFQSPIFSPSKNCSRHNWGPQGPFSFFLLHPSGPHTWMSHVTHINESCHTYEWPISHTWEPVCPLNRVRLIYEWVMSHV